MLKPTHPVVAVMKAIYEDDNDENEDPSDNGQGHPTNNPLVSS